MTVVAAIAREGEVVMAADRQTTFQNQTVYGATKIRRIMIGSGDQEVLIAACGNGALPNLLTQRAKIDSVPEPDAGPAAMQQWADVVASAMTEVLAGTEPAMLGHTPAPPPAVVAAAVALACRFNVYCGVDRLGPQIDVL